MAMGRDFCKAIIKWASEEARLSLGDVVLVKKLTGSDPGDPVQGISPTFTYTVLKTRAIISSLTQSDVLNSGGLYQVGDLSVAMNEDLEEVSDTTRGTGDRIVWRGNEYRIVGKKRNENVGDRDHFFSYTLRKVD